MVLTFDVGKFMYYIKTQLSFSCVFYRICNSHTAAARNLCLAACVFGCAELLESEMWNFVWR
jgi:hypothetical protein